MPNLDKINQFPHISKITPPPARARKLYQIVDVAVIASDCPYRKATAYIVAETEEDVYKWLATDSEWKHEVATIKDEDIPYRFVINEYDFVEYKPLP